MAVLHTADGSSILSGSTREDLLPLPKNANTQRYGFNMTNRTPPKIDPDKLDFSQWHPLDHSPGKECREYYGGFRNHMTMLWDFKWDMPSKIKKVTHCFWGRHHSSSWFKGDGTGWESVKYAGQMCTWCMKDLPEEQPFERRVV